MTALNGMSRPAVHMLSAATWTEHRAARRARPADWLLDQGSATDQSDAELAAELVREQMFRFLHQEVPYALEVRTICRS